MSRKVDYLIVGLGLAGSALAWELMQRGKTIMVIDNPAKNKASSLAAGLFNPVTGKYLVKTWKADIIFPFFENFYSQAEKILKQNFFHLLPIYTPFSSQEEKNLWKQKSATDELKQFLLALHDGPVFEHQVNNSLGGIEIAHSGYLHVELWLESVRNFLIAQNSYREGVVDESGITFNETVTLQDIQADKIIFCNGLSALQTNWFKKLPLIPLKGELLTVKIDAQLERIYNRGVYLVPGSDENTYKVGSTYDRPPFNDGVSLESRNMLKSKLHELTPYTFKIIHQDWGIRPTTPDRRPILGAHPANKNIIIFNGLGTKGVSLAPYFAHHLADWLDGQSALSDEVNIYRFKALYSR